MTKKIEGALDTPLTWTEVRMRLEQETRDELLKWLMSGQIIGEKLEVHLDHFHGGRLGTLVCEVKEWKYKEIKD
jgi:hypothetical protein